MAIVANGLLQTIVAGNRQNARHPATFTPSKVQAMRSVTKP